MFVKKIIWIYHDIPFSPIANSKSIQLCQSYNSLWPYFMPLDHTSSDTPHFTQTLPPLDPPPLPLPPLPLKDNIHKFPGVPHSPLL